MHGAATHTTYVTSFRPALASVCVCVQKSDIRLQPNGFIGFTGFTGVEEGSPNHQGDKVMIYGLHMYNLDMSTPGEDTTIMHESEKQTRGEHATDVPPSVAFR